MAIFPATRGVLDLISESLRCLGFGLLGEERSESRRSRARYGGARCASLSTPIRAWIPFDCEADACGGVARRREPRLTGAVSRRQRPPARARRVREALEKWHPRGPLVLVTWRALFA